MRDRPSRCIMAEANFSARLLCVALMAAATALAQVPGYGGPGVATPGGKQAGMRGSEPVSIRPYFGVSAITDNGLIGVGLNQKGEIADPGRLYGVEANVGAYGVKTWRKRQLGLDYQGNYRNYNTKTYFNGSDHLLNLNYGQQVGRRSSFSLNTVAGTTSRTTGGTFGIGFIDPTLLGTTFTDLFDNRAYFLNVGGSFTTTIRGRNQISATGSAFAVRRQSKALVGMNGQTASGTFSRQVNRRTSVGLAYMYFHVDYPRVFGEADAHTLMLQLSRQLGRRWTMALGTGAFLTDFTGVRTVEVDPVVAELFGITQGREAFNTVNVNSAFNLSLSRAMRRGFFSVGYSRGANPGNGVLLVNRMESVMANYSYNSGFRWSFSGYGGYISQAGYGAYNGAYKMYNGGFVASRNLTKDVFFNAGIDFRRNQVQANSNFRRFSTRLSAGIMYSPGAIPISLR